MRHQLGWSVLWLGAPFLACTGPVSELDASVRTDSGGDAASIEPCTRDRDCSDGLFCTGEERCRPGESGTDARGCVTIPPPCDASECDEPMGRCLACAPDLRDVDGDSYVARACGGNDCDDTNPSIHPRATERCDLEGVDEDCNAETWGDDADGDGAVAASCCQVVTGGELLCGADCDDGDSAIHSGATETCNALDDDCDASIDEDFDCPQSVAVSGTNSCGRDGVRQCSETCAWADDEFYRAESAASCDYCDDSGLGLGEEVPFATEMQTITVEAASAWTGHGDAQNCMFCMPASWLVVDAPSERGAVYANPIRLGYDQAYAQVTVDTRASSSNPDGSWTLAMLADPPASWLGSTAFPDTDGLAVTWSFRALGFSFGPSDTLSLFELRSSGGARLIGRTTSNVGPDQDGPDGTLVRQTIWIELTPDDPRTGAVDETALAVIGPIGTGLECGNASTAGACGVRLFPGLVVHVGVIAQATATEHVSVRAPLAQMMLNATCAP